MTKKGATTLLVISFVCVLISLVYLLLFVIWKMLFVGNSDALVLFLLVAPLFFPIIGTEEYEWIIFPIMLVVFLVSLCIWFTCKQKIDRLRNIEKEMKEYENEQLRKEIEDKRIREEAELELKRIREERKAQREERQRQNEERMKELRANLEKIQEGKK